MKNLIILGLILLSPRSFAANGSGNISNVMTLGGVNTVDGLNIGEANSQGYFTLFVGSGGTTTNNFYPFYKNGVAYQVTAGKTFQAVKICSLSSAASTLFQLLTATSSFAFNASSVTGGVFQGGASGTGAAVYAMISNISTNAWLCSSSTYSAAASTFMGVEVNGTSAVNFMVLGKEI